MKFNIILTASKLMAFMMLSCAFTLDLINKGNGTFLFAVPFVVTLIGIKQYLDRNKVDNSQNPL